MNLSNFLFSVGFLRNQSWEIIKHTQINLDHYIFDSYTFYRIIEINITNVDDFGKHFLALVTNEGLSFVQGSDFQHDLIEASKEFERGSNSHAMCFIGDSQTGEVLGSLSIQR